MTENAERNRGRPQKTVDEARANAGSKKALTRAEQKLLRKIGEYTGKRAKSGLDYAISVAAEWEAQLILAGISQADARREAARLASDDLTVRQAHEANAENSAAKVDHGRRLIAIQTIWETDPATGQMRPVSLAENAQDCGDQVPEPLSDRAKDGGYQRERSRMEKIARKLTGKDGSRARENAAQTAQMGNLGVELQAAGQADKIQLARVRPGRKPKNRA